MPLRPPQQEGLSMAARKVTITVEGDGPSGQSAVLRLLSAIAASLKNDDGPPEPMPPGRSAA
jgi:hypothetical protein